MSWLKKVLESIGGDEEAARPDPAARRSPDSLDLTRFSDKYRGYAHRALSSRAATLEALNCPGDPTARRLLEGVGREVDEVTNAVYDLSLRADSIARGLGSSRLADLSREVEDLDRRLTTASDPYTREQYRTALDGKLRQMQNLADTELAVGRWDARIEAAIVSLDTIRSEVLRASASEALASPGVTDELSHRLSEQLDQLRAATEALDEVYRGGTGAV